MTIPAIVPPSVDGLDQQPVAAPPAQPKPQAYGSPFALAAAMGIAQAAQSILGDLGTNWGNEAERERQFENIGSGVAQLALKSMGALGRATPKPEPKPPATMPPADD